MARIDYPIVDRHDQNIAHAFAVFEREGREPIALYRLLAAAPGMLRGFAEYSRALRYEGSTPRALRELLILRVAQLTGCSYEWFHHAPMAATAGVSPRQIEQLHAWAASDVFSDAERAALRYAEQVLGDYANHAVGGTGQSNETFTDGSFAELRSSFADHEIVELTLLVSHYGAVTRVLAGLKVELEPEYQTDDPRWHSER